MGGFKEFVLTLIAAMPVCTVCGGAGAENPTPNEIASMQAEVQSLRATVDRLERERATGSLALQRADEMEALVMDVLADADSRASLLQAGVASGYDKGFFIASADGSFRLRINGRFHARFTYNHQDNSAEDDDRWGFENRRFRMSFQGHVIDPSWRYKIGGAFDRDSGVFETSDVYLAKDLGDGWELTAGQFKLPFQREWMVSPFRQLVADRSLVYGAFRVRRSDGVQISHECEKFSMKLAVSDGANNDDTQAVDEDTEVALTGRVEWLVDGKWKQFKDFTGWTDDGFGLLLGAAGHWERDEYGSAAGPEEETISWTVDASAEFAGASLFAAVTGRSLDTTGQTQWGGVLQGGFFLVPDKWDLFARFEYGDDDSAAENLSLLTVGVNRYFAQHNLKWTADLGYAFNPIADHWASSGAGYREDENGDDGQTVLRTQLQLLF